MKQEHTPVTAPEMLKTLKGLSDTLLDVYNSEIDEQISLALLNAKIDLDSLISKIEGDD